MLSPDDVNVYSDNSNNLTLGVDIAYVCCRVPGNDIYATRRNLTYMSITFA